MLKIFLTGDNHIGLKYASHSAAEQIRAKRTDAFRGMVEAANAEGCGLFVIAGDMFENTYSVSKRDIVSLLDILSHFNGTAAVLPGNHDYYDETSKLWQYFNEAVKEYDNIMPLTEYRPYTLSCGDDDAVLYPALCTSLHSAPGENNLGWIKNADIVPGSIYRIGIAHGAVKGETIDSEGEYFLMTRDELESIPVDVWLIGHTHVPFPRDLKEDSYTSGERIFNAGTHVQTDVSCRTPGECFIIEIDSDKTVRAKKFVSGNIGFYRKNIEVRAGGLSRTLINELAGIGDRSVVDITLTGTVSDDEYENRRDIIETALSRFIEGTYNDSALSRLITSEIIDAEFPETSFSAKLLKALLDNPMEAQLTYELLKGLKEDR